MGRFSQYLGKTELEVAGEKFELDVKLRDLQTLMSKKMDSEEGMQNMTDLIMEIVKRSYPNESVEELEAFMSKNFVEFIKQFSIAVLGVTEEDFKQTEKKLTSQ